MIVEVAIASIAAVVCVTLRSVVTLVKLTNEAEEAFELLDPNLVASRRAAIEKKRAIVQAQRDLYFEGWKTCKAQGMDSLPDWQNVVRLDEELARLANDEGKLPLPPRNSS